MTIKTTTALSTSVPSTAGPGFHEASRRSDNGPSITMETRARELAEKLLKTALLDGKLLSSESLSALNVPGVSIAVALAHQGEVLPLCYGLRNSSTRQPVKVSTCFQAASLSKPVAAVGCLRMVQAGLLDLDENINTYLRADWRVPEDKPAITLRQLLSHRAGLSTHGFGGYQDQGEKQVLPSLGDILTGTGAANSEKVAFTYLPTISYIYSGGGYVVLQKIMEDVAGKPFSLLMKELVFEPLAMRQSTFELRPQGEDVSAGHMGGPKPVNGASPYYLYPESAAAGLWTTPSDLCKVLMAIQGSLRKSLKDKEQESESGMPETGDREVSLKFPSDASWTTNFLTEGLAKELVTLHFPSPDPSSGYGLGFNVERNRETGHLALSHSGANEGFTSWFGMEMTTGVGLCVMTNGDYFAASPLISQLKIAIAQAYPFFSEIFEFAQGLKGFDQTASTTTLEGLEKEFGGIYSLTPQTGTEKSLAQQSEMGPAIEVTVEAVCDKADKKPGLQVSLSSLPSSCFFANQVDKQTFRLRGYNCTLKFSFSSKGGEDDSKDKGIEEQKVVGLEIAQSYSDRLVLSNRRKRNREEAFTS